MPESRDRLVREEPFTPISRPRSIGGIWVDLNQERGSFSNGVGGFGRTMFGSPMVTRGSVMGSQGVMRSRVSPMVSRGSVRRMNSNLSVGQENLPSLRTGGRGRGRARTSTLPVWYPRTPLRDITHIVNAIERRRARLIEAERQRLASPLPEESSERSDLPAPGAALEHMFLSPADKTTGPVHNLPTILHGKQAEGESEFLTPQKKLLNSIEQVEKIVTEELRKLKRTPSVKRAEREKKVRTLMSMR